MITSPPAQFVDHLESYSTKIENGQGTDELSIGEADIPTITLNQNRLFAFCSVDSQVSTEEVRTFVSENEPEVFKDDTLFEITVAVSGLEESFEGEEIFGRGKKISTPGSAIARLIGMPDGWKKVQKSYLKQTLEPLRFSGEIRLADLYLRVDGETHEALEWLENRLDWRNSDNPTVYLRAEAGKGKSTLLAETARRLKSRSGGPLPLYIPLRNLKRETGISWAGISDCVGVMGDAAENLRRAVQSGLVIPLLDGLDEIAGRYDPTTIQEVEQIILNDLRGVNSSIVMSGRTTEATHLDSSYVMDVGVEIPDSSNESFEEYTQIVIESTTPKWPKISRSVDDLIVQDGHSNEDHPSQQQKEDILDWVKIVFDDLGKEKSLFFIQSLVCIGRTYQSENKPFLIRGQKEPDNRRPPLQDVCLLAAALACHREKEKIEDIAQRQFSTEGQIRVLTLMALLASAENTLKAEMPSPNEVAKRVFNVDPTNQNEVFTAIIRQLQRHALLFSTDSAAAADWTPSFLSEWVKSALLIRAWLKKDDLSNLLDDDRIARKVIARAERARYAYEYIVPGLVSNGVIDDVGHLAELLVAETDRNESPSGGSNFWRLYAGVGDSDRSEITDMPDCVYPMTDLSDIDVEGVEFGVSFSSTLSIFVQADFRNCNFYGCEFMQSDFTHSTLSNCVFEEVVFQHCDGPITFDNCQFIDVKFKDVRGAIPGYKFVGCEFKDNTIIEQTELLESEDFGPVASFSDCVSYVEVEDLIAGDMTGIEQYSSVEGLDNEYSPERSRADKCLESLIKRFFVRWAGEGDRRQIRDYIRTSSLGRGVWPDGHPTKSEFEDILQSEGFTKGGRQHHLWAPWSSIAGGGEEGMQIRSQLQEFLRTGEESPVVRRLRQKIKDAARWS